jgi:hypothetical protein
VDGVGATRESSGQWERSLTVQYGSLAGSVPCAQTVLRAGDRSLARHVVGLPGSRLGERRVLAALAEAGDEPAEEDYRENTAEVLR